MLNYLIVDGRLIIVLLVIGCMFVHAGTGTADKKEEKVIEIVATPKVAKRPRWIRFEPKAIGLKEPLKYRWSFGDGQESADMLPKPHFYEYGRYNVKLEVTDGDGKLYTAGIMINVASPG